MKHLFRLGVVSCTLTIAIYSLVAVHGTPIAASTIAAAKQSLLPVPPVPTLTALAGGRIEPHSDYVRVTYVSATGETTASAEATYSAGARTLTVVHSPPAEDGAIGYNVYAVKNNGGNGTGHTLQNAAPIALGSDLTEPATGWTLSGAAPPTSNDAFIAIAERTVPIDSNGGYVEAPVVKGAEAAVVLPSNDAPVGTQLSLTSVSGLQDGAAAPPLDVSSTTPKLTIVQTIGFAFSNDVTMKGFPTFKLTLPHDSKAAAPYLLDIFDGSSRSLLATIPAYTYRNLTFLSDFTTPFHAIAGRRYYAEMLANSPAAFSATIGAVAQSVQLPTAGGVMVTASLPKATVSAGSSYSIYASTARPVGLPAPSAPGMGTPVYYASIAVTGTVAYAGTATLAVTLPPSLWGDLHRYRLAAYDSEIARKTWFPGVAPVTIRGRTLTFAATLPPFLGWRQYGIALYAAAGLGQTGEAHARQLVSAGAAPKAHAPVVVVVGDSISLLTIIPPSGVGCTPGWGPLPECQYSHDPRFNWPGVLAQITGYDVINVSALGTQTTVNSYTGESMLSMMIPQIPANAQVVVCQCGVNDLSLSNQSPQTSSRAETITEAILGRAPAAHIVYIGLRCVTGCGRAGVDAWNDVQRRLASKYGAFIDLIPLAADGASDAFPDGSHPTPQTARIIASKTAEAMAPWNLKNR